MKSTTGNQVVITTGSEPLPEHRSATGAIVIGNRRYWLEVVGMCDGELEGLEYSVRLQFELNGNPFEEPTSPVLLTSMSYRPVREMPLMTIGQRRLRTLHRGGFPRMVEKLLGLKAEYGDEPDFDEHYEALLWLTALGAHRKRAGVTGKPDVFFAQVASARVEAQERWPRGAIRNMPGEWPELFTKQETKSKTDAATSAKVRRAQDKGMLEKVDGRWRLTKKATLLLPRTRERKDTK